MDEVRLHDCPLARVHRRLEDSHHQWHQAEQSYFEPEQFRLGIQSTIQTLRTVTFILQNHKHEIAEFDEWYEGWQTKMRAEPLMRWMVDARNKIEKQGDLELHSMVRAEIIASYLEEGRSVDVPTNLFEGPAELLNSIPKNDLGRHIKNHGILKIQRRWVENTLPDYELLDAVAVAYGRISQLLADAHRQMGLETPVTTNVKTGEEFGESGLREGRMPCMIGHAGGRALDIGLWDGRPLGIANKSRTVKREEAERAAAAFPVRLQDIFPHSATNNEQILKGLFETARKVFLKDGRHVSIVFLLCETKPIKLMSLRPEEHGHKYVMMRDVADEVIRHGADAVVMLAEVWMAPFDKFRAYQRAIDAPNRLEALTGTLVANDGQMIELAAEIIRKNDEIQLADTITLLDPALFSFAPVLRAWGQEIPAAWKGPASGDSTA